MQGVLARLRELGVPEVQEVSGERESMVFALPKELREPAARDSANPSLAAPDPLD